MSVLIEGMEMPKEDEEIIIRISPNGTVMTEYALPITGVKAVHVPPHGRLIDADAVIDLVMQYCPDDDGVCSKAGADLRELLDEIEDLPTIIPASEMEVERWKN